MSADRDQWGGLKALSLWACCAGVAIIGSFAAMSLPAISDNSGSQTDMMQIADAEISDQNAGIDRSITTGSVEKPRQSQNLSPMRSDRFSNSRDMDAIRLTISSMQRQINALSARNDRLERQLQELRQRSNPAQDNFVTGSIQRDGAKPNMPASVAMPSNSSAMQTPLDTQARKATDTMMQEQANLALAKLSQTESDQSGVQTDINNIRAAALSASAIDLGPGVSFDALRDRWERVKQAAPDSVGKLNARAVLKETANGLQAHLIVGPVSGLDQAQWLCGKVLEARFGSCAPSVFEGQRL